VKTGHSKGEPLPAEAPFPVAIRARGAPGEDCSPGYLGDDDDWCSIDVIIRTRNSEGTIDAVLSAIEASRGILARVICIDNGSVDRTREIVCGRASILEYPFPDFNYSAALNLAIPILRHELVLIISSHTVIGNGDALRYAVSLLRERAAVAAVALSGAGYGAFRVAETTSANFNGWNGVWNTASLFRTSLLKERPFEIEVFSAEDQEWSRWVIERKGMSILHLEGCAMEVRNIRKDDISKRVKEWSCIAYYCYPKYLGLPFIFGRLLRVGACVLCGRAREAHFWLAVALALVRTKFRGPRGNSAY
jgi:glycosyltransferase involved in cell wall biosynthesis